jgi:DNA-binding response OmpR family regulator
MQKVLIVEDEPLLLKALFERIAREYECITAINGEDAKDIALKQHPDLILPFLSDLRKDEWGKSAKVIVLTNLSDDRSMEEANKLNILQYLIKANLKLDEVMEHIHATLGQKA